jgi:hypothetical protein
MKGRNYMEILENPDSSYEWLKNIPSGQCFRNIHNDRIYMKTQSTDKQCILYNENCEDVQLTYGCVDLLNGMIVYISNDKVIPVNATLLINHNKEDK